MTRTQEPGHNWSHQLHSPPMARVTLNPVLDQISGSVGDLVFRRTPSGGQSIASKPSPPAGGPSEAQLAQRDRFRRAAAYGRSVMADPEARAFYDALAAARKVPVFSLVVADFLHAPTVGAVDVSGYAGAAGDVVRVEAWDDVEVVRVEVVLTDGAGAVLETGEAVSDGWRWTYTAQAAAPPGATVTVTARAVDRPGGVGEAEAEVAVPA